MINMHFNREQIVCYAWYAIRPPGIFPIPALERGYYNLAFDFSCRKLVIDAFSKLIRDDISVDKIVFELSPLPNDSPRSFDETWPEEIDDPKEEFKLLTIIRDSEVNSIKVISDTTDNSLTILIGESSLYYFFFKLYCGLKISASMYATFLTVEIGEKKEKKNMYFWYTVESTPYFIV